MDSIRLGQFVLVREIRVAATDVLKSFAFFGVFRGQEDYPQPNLMR
jgi:hypothetical protein